MRPFRLAVVVGVLSLSLAGAAKAGSIPRDGCWCTEESLHCYNMRRDVSNFWGEWAGANHTFTMCQDRYGNTSVYEDNWAQRDYSRNNLGSAWVEEDMGCIKLDSLDAAKAQTDQGFANACSGYAACAGDNTVFECENSYWPFDACYCFPWQLGFRSRLQHAFVIECPVQGGGVSGGGSSDPSDYDYGPYAAYDWPEYEDDGTSLWRVCIDYCTATVGTAVYSGGEQIGGSVSCVEWNTECWLEWYYN